MIDASATTIINKNCFDDKIYMLTLYLTRRNRGRHVYSVANIVFSELVSTFSSYQVASASSVPVCLQGVFLVIEQAA